MQFWWNQNQHTTTEFRLQWCSFCHFRSPAAILRGTRAHTANTTSAPATPSMASSAVMHLRIKRQAETIFMLVEPSDSFGKLIAQVRAAERRE